MSGRKKILICITVAPFLMALALTYFLTVNAESSVIEKKDMTASRFSTTRKTKEQNTSPILDNRNATDIVRLMQRLGNKPSIATLNKLFDDCFHPKQVQVTNEAIKQSLVMRKWGEIAPIQGLEKLETASYGILYGPSLFGGWASKDPDAAITYYEEHYLKRGKDEHFPVLPSIIHEYAMHSPEDAWNWLASHQEQMQEKIFLRSKNNFLLAIAEQDPTLLPKFISKTGTEDMDNNAYHIALRCVHSDSTSFEWIDSLPYEAKIQAEAGRIMGTSKGNLEKVKSELLQLPSEGRLEITKLLSEHILSEGRTDQQERINWIKESLPESEIPEDLKNKIEALSTDR